MQDNGAPHSFDVEQQVLGAMMLNKQAASKALALLTRRTFYAGKHAEIFDAISRLFADDKGADITLVCEELKRCGVLEECGGVGYIADVAASVGTSSHVTAHAEILLDKAIRRHLITRSQQLVVECNDPSTDMSSAIERFESDLFKIATRRQHNGFRHISHYAEMAFDHIEAAYHAGGCIAGLPSGYWLLDRKLSGFRDGQLYIIAARPGMGKTALMLNFAATLALEHRKPVGIFSLEMTGDSLAQRMIANDASVDGLDLANGRLAEEDWGRVMNSVIRIRNAPLHIDETSGISPLELRAKAQRLVHEHDVQMIMVDYLQLMKLHYRAENRNLEIGEFTSSLKALAKEMRIPVVVASQITRDIEKRGDNRPRLSDLRESGNIEQDADVVMFVHRPEYFGSESDKDGKSTEGQASIIVAKQRHGPVGEVPVVWRPQYQRFEDIVPEALDDERPY